MIIEKRILDFEKLGLGNGVHKLSYKRFCLLSTNSEWRYHHV